MGLVDHEWLRRRLRRWYRVHGRHDLPWRLTRDRYAVLVSEVMLQQTQVDRVLPYWKAWMERWPEGRALAEAPAADVVRAWSGLGYNRRAVNLQRAAQKAVEQWGGFPGRPELLMTLPGVGRYTANAVACFAGGRRVTVLDTNVARVVARAFLGVANGKAAPTRALEDAAQRLLPRRAAREWNLAVMDLGAMVCTAARPACTSCPVERGCAWRSAGYPEGPDPDPQRRAPRFEDTARFARGRIVQLLREQGPTPFGVLAEGLPEAHRGHAQLYLEGLERDGLAERLDQGRWALPGEG